MKIGVVVPTFKQEEFLPATLASIAGQAYTPVSVVVVDGAESTQVRKIVGDFKDLLDIRLISEKDRGQADAINKGFNELDADIFCWLNSDDMFMPGAFATILKTFQQSPSTSVIYGNAIILDEEHSNARLAEVEDFDRNRLSFNDFIIQPSTFWKREVWDTVGPLSETHHFVLDWEWWLRASAIYRFEKCPACLSIYRIHSAHKTGSRRDERLEEVLSLVERYAPPGYAECMRAVAPIASDLVRLKSRLYRYGLIPLRKLFYPGLYRRFGSRMIEDVIPAVL